MKKFEDWANEFGLTFSEDKCSYIMIKANKRITHFPCIRLNGRRISFSGELKYLGIYFDQNFSFIPHLTKIQDKVGRFFEKLRRIIRATWGLSPRVTKEIYLAVYERMVLYGADFWYTNNVKMNDKLIQIQRQPLLAISKAYRTVSNEALQVLCGCVPLDIKAKVCSKVAEITRGVEPLVGIVDFELSIRVPPWTVQRIGWDVYSESNRREFEIFTDGSKTEAGVGCAFVAFQKQKEYHHQSSRLGDMASVFMAQVCAIRLAVEFAVDSGIQTVDIISDSRSALQALNSLAECREILMDIKTRISSSNNEVRLLWVRAHQGTVGNERADTLAKEATTLPDVDFEFKQSLQSRKFAVKKQAIEEWQRRWSCSIKGIRTRNFFPKVSTIRVKGDFYVNQVYTDHGIFRPYQRRFFGKSDVCWCGDEIGDADHVLLKCDKWSENRTRFGLRADSLRVAVTNPQFKDYVREILHELLTLECGVS